MTEQELDRYRNFVLAVVGMGSAGVLLLALFAREVSPEAKFQVVDQYQGRDVIRYVDPSNGWNYFLDCRRDR